MSPKQDALDTLRSAQTMLQDGTPMTGLKVNMLLATVSYAAVCVEKIQELKRLRRTEGNHVE